MTPRNVILTGVPRAGTTLSSHLLGQVPDTVVLHEPMRGRHVAPGLTPPQRVAIIHDFFAEQRASLLASGLAASRTVDGTVPSNPFGTETVASGLRRHLDAPGTVTIDKQLTPDFTLIVKHLASFAALIDVLVGDFPVYAIVRNPLAALASWSTLDAPLRRGHIGPAEKLDPDLKQRLKAEPDALARQLVLLDWFFDRVTTHLPPAAIVTYESIVATHGQALRVIVPGASELTTPLTSRNQNDLYDHAAMLLAGERLLATDGAYWRLYPRSAVEMLMAEIAARRAPA